MKGVLEMDLVLFNKNYTVQGKSTESYHTDEKTIVSPMSGHDGRQM